jgi:hypothetical protein
MRAFFFYSSLALLMSLQSLGLAAARSQKRTCFKNLDHLAVGEQHRVTLPICAE